MLSVTADTNIYVSAFHFGGVPRQLIDMAEAGEVRLAISDDIMNEVQRVLRDKFHWSDSALKELEREVSGFTERVRPLRAVDTIKDDPPDNRILECAAAAKSDFIVTGDEHLLRLRRYGDVRIVRVAHFLELAPKESGPPALKG